MEKIAHHLAGVVVFTNTDALKTFLHVYLTRASSKLLVINTHKGRYWFKRMPFGAKMSQDVFQMKMDLIMEKCLGVISIHNDIVIYGTAEKDHDANLINLLNVAQLEDLVLNSKKLEFKQPRVSFIVILSCLNEEYLERLHHGHLSATKVQPNAHQAAKQFL